MRRYHESEEITATKVDGGMAFGEDEVSAAVSKFYTEWMQTRWESRISSYRA